MKQNLGIVLIALGLVAIAIGIYGLVGKEERDLSASVVPIAVGFVVCWFGGRVHLQIKRGRS